MASERIEVRASMKDEFTRPLRGIQRGLTGFTKGALGGFGSLIKAVTSFRGILLTIGSAYVVRSFSRLITETAKLGDTLQKLAIRTGTSVEFLSEMRFATQQAGQSFETFTKALIRGQRTIGDMTLFGLKEATDSFNALGPAVVDAIQAGESFEQLLPKIAEGLANIADENQRVALAQHIFGRSGADLLPLFEKGAKGIEDLRKKSRELGITWDRLQADTAAEFNDAMNRLNRSFEGIKKELAVGVMPAFTRFFDEVTEWLRENRHDIIGFFRDDLPAAIQEVEIAVNRMERGFQKAVRAYLEVGKWTSFVVGPAGSKALGYNPEERQRAYAESLARSKELEMDLAGIMTRQSMREKERAAEDLAADLRRSIERSERMGPPAGAVITPEGAFVMPGRQGLPSGLPPNPPSWAMEQAAAAKELEKWNDALIETKRRIEETYAPWRQMQDVIWSTTDAFASGLGGALVEVAKNANNAGEAMRQFGIDLLDTVAKMTAEAGIKSLIGIGITSLGSAFSGTAASGGSAGGQQPRMISAQGVAVRQHGGVLPPGINSYTLMHGGAHGEAYIPLEQGGRIPVEFTGGGGGGTQVLVVNAMDSRDVHRFFVEGMRANPHLITGAVAKAFQNSRTYRGQYG